MAGYHLKPAVETDHDFHRRRLRQRPRDLGCCRVSGQVRRVLVDDNDRVKKGDVLVRLDKERFEDQVAVKQAAVAAAEADLAAAEAQTARSGRPAPDRSVPARRPIEDVHTQVANLRSNIATFKSRQATLELAGNNFRRGEELSPSGGISKEELDQRRQSVKVAQAALDQALEAVLGVASRPRASRPAPTGHDLGEVPDDLDQNYSAVRQALGQLIPERALLGVRSPFVGLEPQAGPRDILEARPANGNLDRIFANLIAQAPAIKQAETKLQQARRDLAQAELDLRYCDIVSEIDGVVTSRNVNPGNNVQAGQSLMAVRSLTEIWIDANFKETQLADLRIGQRVRCEVDMYGSRREFEGRITGFTMGTGQTLALLPPQNATGNFVKIVQRLPVRIELTGLRSGQGPAVRRPVGRPLRVLQGAADGAARRGGLATIGHSSGGADRLDFVTSVEHKPEVRIGRSGVPEDVLAPHARHGSAFSGLLAYGAAMQLIVRMMVRMNRRGSGDVGFWRGTAVMAIVTVITAVGHLIQIGLWAVAFLVCGQVSTLETAFCLSAQNFTAFGYGDVVLSERWRLLSPLEATRRPSVFRNVDSRVVRDHELVDRKPATLRDRVPDRGDREGGASVGGRRRMVELSTPILVRRTLVRSGRATSRVALTPAAVGRPVFNPWLVGVAVVVPRSWRFWTRRSPRPR